MVDARVISANHAHLSTVDAGFKAFATEAGAPPNLAGAPSLEFGLSLHGRRARLRHPAGRRGPAGAG